MEKTNISLVLPDCSMEVEWEKLCLPNKTPANMKSIKVILSPTEMSWYQNWGFSSRFLPHPPAPFSSDDMDVGRLSSNQGLTVFKDPLVLLDFARTDTCLSDSERKAFTTVTLIHRHNSVTLAQKI